MAGGKGTRLKPLTHVIPKALIPLREKPIIQIIIENFASYGMKDFYISVNYKQEMIKQYLRDLKNSKVKIKYTKEEMPLGTAGSLNLLKDHLSSTFFLSNCDIVVDQNLIEVYRYHEANNNEMTIISALKNYHIPYGTITTSRGGILRSLTEKPELTFQVNTGVYILEPHLLREIPENKTYDITNLIKKIKIRGGKIGVFPVSENSWIDIGDWTEYRNALSTTFQKDSE
jgi:NDP-sugar pyrophosphorylase family protein